MSRMPGHLRGGHRGGIKPAARLPWYSPGHGQQFAGRAGSAALPRTLTRRNRPPIVRRHAGSAVALAVLMAGGCTATPTVPVPSTPAAPTVTSVSVPPAIDSGPVITVEAEVRWVVAHPGCTLMRVGAD